MNWAHFKDVLPIITLMLGYFGTLFSQSRFEQRDRKRAIAQRITDLEIESLIELQDILAKLPAEWIAWVKALNVALMGGLTIDESMEASEAPNQLKNRAMMLVTRFSLSDIAGQVMDAIRTICDEPAVIAGQLSRNESLDLRSDERWSASLTANVIIGARLQTAVDREIPDGE
jgi:hypothetical protein